MISGTFYIVPSDPLVGGTVMAKMVDRVECFLNIWRYFRNHFEYSSYVSIGVSYVDSLKTAHI